MKINCLHGFFIFEEEKVGQISDFMSLFGFSILRTDRWFTFASLKDAPDYAIQGSTYLNAPATKTFEGEPWEILNANQLVYDFSLNLVRPIASVSSVIELGRAANYFTSAGLIIPGSLTREGKKVSGYTCWFSFDTTRFRYSEVTYV